MNRFQRGLMTFKVGMALWKIKREFKQVEKHLAKARRAEAKAAQTRTDAKILNDALNVPDS